MKDFETKLYPLTERQVEILKSLVSTSWDEEKHMVESELIYMDELVGIHDVLMLDAPDVEIMKQEIHKLKNVVQGLQLQIKLLEKDS